MPVPHRLPDSDGSVWWTGRSLLSGTAEYGGMSAEEILSLENPTRRLYSESLETSKIERAADSSADHEKAGDGKLTFCRYLCSHKEEERKQNELGKGILKYKVFFESDNGSGTSAGQILKRLLRIEEKADTIKLSTIYHLR